MARVPRFDLPQGMPSGVSITPLVRRVGRGMSATQLRVGGTAFPGRPAAGDLFYRTDFSAWFYWDGTRWLSVELATAHFQMLANTTDGAQWAGVALPLLGSDIFVVDMITTLRVQTTNNGTNYWTASVYKASTAGATISLGTLNTSAAAINTWPSQRASIGAALTIATYTWLLGDVVKTGAPGAIDVYGLIRYRVVAT